jgi:Kae1-associated kinase Bud32
MTTMAITMQCIDGRRIKDCIDTLPEEDQRSICAIIGKGIAALHKQDIVHGDLTTSNLILHQNRVYFIDFGLGEKTGDLEKRGVDLHLLMEAFTAAHPEERLFSWVLAAYEKQVSWGLAVKKKVAEIAERGRYVERGK